MPSEERFLCSAQSFCFVLVKPRAAPKVSSQLQPPVATSEPDQSRLKLQWKVSYILLLQEANCRPSTRMYNEVSG